MAQPTSRDELKQYCLRQLGAPVLEINVATEQCEDLIDDALQLWNERHYDGVSQVYYKYKITEADIDRGKAQGGESGTKGAGITTTTVNTTVGVTTSFEYWENSNYIPVPANIIGVNKIWQYDNAQSMSIANMFSFKYQLFLNDVYYWGNSDLLGYSMAMSYVETLNFLLNTHKQIRFNQRMDRLYMDVDWGDVTKDQYIVIDCWAALDGNTYTGVWNDPFLKKYTTALIKRQWGQNLLKFQGVKLPGGIELNGRQIYDDAQKDLEVIREQMSNTYELPPLDMVG